MRTTAFYSPVSLTFVKEDGKTIKTDVIFYALEISESIEKWNERFSDYLKENFPEIKRAKFNFDRYGEGITQKDRWFLNAVVECDDDFSDALVEAALRKLYTGDISEEFSKEPVFEKTDREKMYVSLWNEEKSFVLIKEKLEERFDFRYKLYCRDCKYMLKIDNTDETGQGLCTFQPCYEPITLDTRCKFLPETSELRCGDCDRLGKDFACFTCSEEDSASPNGHLCAGFIDKKKVDVMNALSFWKMHNIYSREKVLKILDEFEQEFKTPFD